MAQTKMNKTGTRIFTGLHGAVYKLTKGRVGGKMSGGQILVLGTTGRNSGKKRERPLIGMDHPDGWEIG
ncbi:MAG: nitroreductase/quinone reductase family protein, partial [Acidimicrobiia bacterium]|nr:nitroreductase/quinone reductase family protein [Acidimicrobiia bacterium]